MKKSYLAPQLIEYGKVGALTLGQGGILPDYTSALVLVNSTCPTQTFVGAGGTVETRVGCINSTS